MSKPAGAIEAVDAGAYNCVGEEVSSMPEIAVGRISDYFSRIMVAGVDLNAPLHVGDRIHILGHTSDTEMDVDSMQIDHQAVTDAHPGDAVGIKITSRARRGDYVFIIQG